MGCRHSCEASEPFNEVRVITISGHLEQFMPPVTAGDVMGTTSPYVLCSASQLLTYGSRHIRPDERLESGRLYFLLPPSVLESTPLDLAALATRLTSLARSASARRAKAEPFATGLVAAKAKEGKTKMRPQPQAWQPVLSTVREVSFSPSLSPMTPVTTKSQVNG